MPARALVPRNVRETQAQGGVWKATEEGQRLWAIDVPDISTEGLPGTTETCTTLVHQVARALLGEAGDEERQQGYPTPDPLYTPPGPLYTPPGHKMGR